MQSLESSRCVSSCEYQMMPTSIREMATAVGRAVKLMQLPGAVHLGHQNTARLPCGRVEQQRLRPGRNRFERRRPTSDHRGELGDLLLRQRTLVINLRQQRRLSFDFVNG